MNPAFALLSLAIRSSCGRGARRPYENSSHAATKLTNDEKASALHEGELGDEPPAKVWNGRPPSGSCSTARIANAVGRWRVQEEMRR